MNDFEVLVVSLSNKDNLVAEVWYKNNIIAQINREQSGFYVNTYKCSYEIDFKQYIEVLERAKVRLEALGAL